MKNILTYLDRNRDSARHDTAVKCTKHVERIIVGVDQRYSVPGLDLDQSEMRTKRTGVMWLTWPGLIIKQQLSWLSGTPSESESSCPPQKINPVAFVYGSDNTVLHIV